VGLCGVRRARATTATVVPCDGYMCPRAVEAPGRCAAGSGCQKSRTVPGATLQRRPAGAQGPARCAPLPRARWKAQRPCSGGRGAPRCEMGTPGAPRSPRRGPSRWPAGRARRGAGAAGRAPASSGGVLASFLVQHVGVSTLSDEARAGMCASSRGNAICEHTWCRSWRYRAAAGLHSSSKDCTACALYLCTTGRRQTMSCAGSGALALIMCSNSLGNCDCMLSLTTGTGSCVPTTFDIVQVRCLAVGCSHHVNSRKILAVWTKRSADALSNVLLSCHSIRDEPAKKKSKRTRTATHRGGAAEKPTLAQNSAGGTAPRKSMRSTAGKSRKNYEFSVYVHT